MIDQSSGVWQAVVTLVGDRIEEMQAQLEIEGVSVERTENLRGRIAFAREVLALPSSDMQLSAPSDAEIFL